MNLPPTWTLLPDGWIDGPNGAQIHTLSSFNGTLFASFHGPLRPTRLEAESDAERMIWALEPRPDREALAKALRCTRLADSPDHVFPPWDHITSQVQREWLAVADEAIRLLASSPLTPRERIFACPSCGPQDRCDEDGCCITHGQDLIEVADEGSAYAVKEACDQLIADHDTDRARLEAENVTLKAAITTHQDAYKRRVDEVDALHARIAEVEKKLSAAYQPPPEYNPALRKTLAAWMIPDVFDALIDAAILAVEDGVITADQAIEARHSKDMMARLILETPEPIPAAF